MNLLIYANTDIGKGSALRRYLDLANDSRRFILFDRPRVGSSVAGPSSSTGMFDPFCEENMGAAREAKLVKSDSKLRQEWLSSAGLLTQTFKAGKFNSLFKERAEQTEDVL